MKSKYSNHVPTSLLIWLIALLISCNSDNRDASENTANTIDSSSAPVSIDTSATASAPENVDTSSGVTPPPPASMSEEKSARGYAIVYCPTRMISNVPSIVNATISKEEFATAYAKFSEKIQGQNPDVAPATISRDIKGDSINIFERMGVKLEFDPDDFKQVSGSEDATKEFADKNSLEWEWIIKPLHSTPRSIINFKFYYLDPTNKENFILEKTISISASVDTRSFTDKWADFLAEDPKTTITVILVPFLTFLGGFFSGRKKKE